MNQEFTLATVFSQIGETNARNKTEIVCNLIEAATNILSTSSIKTEISMQTMLVILLNQCRLNHSHKFQQSTQQLFSVSEELISTTVNCFETIFRRATPEVIRQFYTEKNLLLIAQILSLNEHILSSTTFTIARIDTIKCIMSVFQIHDDASSDDFKMRQKVADLTFRLIPKIVRSLTIVSVGSTHISHQMHSVIAIGRIIHLIFDDYPGMEPSDGHINRFHSSEYDERKKWLEISSTKLIPIFHKLKYLLSCKSREIQQELYILSTILIRRCQRNLSLCMPTLVEMNVALHFDGNDQDDIHYNENLLDIVEELFTALLVHFSRIVHTGSDNEQSTGFMQLMGFILILEKAKRLKILLSDDITREKFMSILVTIVELKHSNNLIDLRQNINNPNDKKIADTLFLWRNNIPWKNYKHFQDHRYDYHIQKICECITKELGVHVFVLEYLSKIILNNSIHCSEALVLIQYILENSSVSAGPIGNLHIMILENLSSDLHWKLETSISYDIHESEVESTSSESLNLKIVSSNILHTCLVIETVGYYSKNMPEQYKAFNLKFLQFLIEKSANSEYMIRAAALLTLERVAANSEVKCVSEFIKINSDYIIQYINSLMVKPNCVNTALLILVNTLNYGTSNSWLEYLVNIVPIIISEGTKRSKSKNLLPFISAYKIILVKVYKYFHEYSTEEKLTNEVKEFEIPTNLIHHQQWCNILDESIMQRSEQYSDNEELRSSPRLNNNNNASQQNNSQLIELTVKILQQNIHWISTRHDYIKFESFECINIGLDIIKHIKIEIFPILHTLWNVIAEQFSGKLEKVLPRYIIPIIAKVILHTKNSIDKHSASQIFNQLIYFINNSAKKMDLQKSFFSKKCSLQVETMEELMKFTPSIFLYLNIQEREFNEFIEAIIFLNSIEPENVFNLYSTQLSRKLAFYDICSFSLKLSRSCNKDKF